MSEEIKNRGVEPDRMVTTDDKLHRRNTFAWVFYGLLAPLAVVALLWTFWLFDLI
jgi:hypothetical protein